MSTTVKHNAIEDMKAVSEAVASGRPVDPALARRVQERAAKVRSSAVEKFGVQVLGSSCEFWTIT